MERWRGDQLSPGCRRSRGWCGRRGRTSSRDDGLMNDPIELFLKWLTDARRTSEFAEACCLSTLGLDDWPNARFVALKKASTDGFIVSGPLDSRKGRELRRTPRAALTFWWPRTLRQVRIQGLAHPLSRSEADRIFADRTRKAQLLAWASNQSQRIKNSSEFRARVREVHEQFEGAPVPRPPNWGGQKIAPIQMEFLTFKEDRMHVRVEYQHQHGCWVANLLQP